jgi:adenylate cyclase
MAKRRAHFQRVGNTLIIPVSVKVLGVFICLLLLSNFTTNFISIQLSQRQIIRLTNTVMVDQLKDLYTNAGSQYQIYQYSHKKYDCFQTLRRAVQPSFQYDHSVAFAVDSFGAIQFMACRNEKTFWSRFVDADALMKLNQNLNEGITEGSITFRTFDGEYFGVYKYQKDWNFYLVRAELRKDTQADTLRVYLITAGIILGLTIGFLWLGTIMMKRLFRNIRSFTNDLYTMQQNQKLELIDLSHAPNDDITYLAASFNSLSSSVNNLLNTFQKFVSKDVVAKAYSEHGIALEGNQRELTILFSDIKGFTYRTETLGNEIIDLLNVHYDRVIHRVHENDGVVGSIIGDAILAIYGTQPSSVSKSADAVRAAWDITNVTAELRETMKKRRVEIEKTRKLTAAELRVYEAVLIDVGVGIDGGNVFYGNIGSKEHMANTVIGDNVNSASRLEGLTRIYHVPVVVSDYIRTEVTKDTDRYHFYEIDTVQVKGKTEGKKIFFPLDTVQIGKETEDEYQIFETALELYYKGDWRSARKAFKLCTLDVAQVFLERMGMKNAPAEWSGIWTMTSK